MAERLGPKTPFEQEHSEKSSGVTRIIKTRNSPRSRYICHFKNLSPHQEVIVHRNTIQQLDLATSFRALSFLTIQDSPQFESKFDTDNIPSTSYTTDGQELSFTTPEQDIELEDVSDVPDLVPITDSGQCSDVSSTSDKGTPRRVVSPILIRKRRFHRSSYSLSPEPQSQQLCCHKRLRRDSWSGCPRIIEK